MISESLGNYDFANPIAELIRHKENSTYKGIDGSRHYVLRIHKLIDGFNYLQLLTQNI